MLIFKHLPPLNEPRLFMAAERTYLSILKLSFQASAVGLVLNKAALLDIFFFGYIDKYLLKASVVLISLAVLTDVYAFLKFFSDIRYIEGAEVVDKKEVVDPRIYMAAERTFLAWVRTSIALMIFGFVVDKFEIFLTELQKKLHIKFSQDITSLKVIGITIMVLSLVALSLGTLNFYKTIKDIDKGYYRTHTGLYIMIGIIIFAINFILLFDVLKLI
ncbi:DUF202 domain-containing protein [Aquifex pyrophilus]